MAWPESDAMTPPSVLAEASVPLSFTAESSTVESIRELGASATPASVEPGLCSALPQATAAAITKNGVMPRPNERVPAVARRSRTGFVDSLMARVVRRTMAPVRCGRTWCAQPRFLNGAARAL